MKLGIVIYTPEAETVSNTLRLGMFALKQGDSVKVFLLARGVESEKLDTERFKITSQMREFLDRGGTIQACGTCLKLREAEGSGLCPVSTMKDLYEIVRDSDRVFTEIFRVLKPGGELYFSDVFADRRIPPPLAEDPVLLGECLGGALYIEDFRRLLARVGCPDYRVVSSSKLTLTDPAIERQAGMIGFRSLTMRAFRLDLEDRCEDYGQVAYYLGTLPEQPHRFMLDDHHAFETGRPHPVCGNTAAMLGRTRYAPHFRIAGDTRVHYGLFDCGPTAAASGPGDSTTSGSSCC